MKKYFIALITLLCCFFMSTPSFAEELPDAPIVLVIDPGHGGENEGTIEGQFVEKEMTLRTATRLASLLEEYEGIEVYLTHTDDADYSLKERAKFAASVNADYLISIHYNASVRHDLFGSEVWIPSRDSLNKQSYGLAWCFLDAFRENGLFIRGIKIKYNDSRKDYYGIIRECNALDIPALIVEHCHVDEERDAAFQDTEDKQLNFAKLDADAIARYFGLSKAGEEIEYEPYPVDMAIEDDTPPETCEISLLEENRDDFQITVQVMGADLSSCLMYYDYSLDGGESFSSLYAWPGCDTLALTNDESFEITLTIPEGLRPDILFRAYNLYDNATESNMISITKAYVTEIESEENVVEEPSLEEKTGFYEVDLVGDDSDQKDNRLRVFLVFCVIVVFILLNVSLFSVLYMHHKNKKRRKRKK